MKIRKYIKKEKKIFQLRMRSKKNFYGREINILTCKKKENRMEKRK